MGTESIASDALLLLLETVNKQSSQIKRLEAIVAGDNFTYDPNPHRHGGKSDTRQLQSSLQALEQQHAAACRFNTSMTEQVQQVEQRVQQLEAQGHLLQQQGRQLQQQLGSPHGQGQHKPDMCMSIMAAGALAAADDTALAARPAHNTVPMGMPGGRSMAARLSKLEQRVDSLTAAAASTEEKLASTSTALHSLDGAVDKQLHNIRTDVKQAILVASSSLRAELEAAAQARQQQDAAQHQAQLKGLTSELDALVSSNQRSLVENLTEEIERRTAATLAASEGRIAGLKEQLDRLEEEKADVGLVTQYTGQVADVFEQLATTVADSTQASIAQLIMQQQELRTAVTNLSASKAEGSNLLQHQQHCQAQLLELQRGLAAAQTAASDAAVAAAVARTALEPMDGLRLQLAETQGTVAALQASIAGLDFATNRTSSEQQQQAQHLQQLASSQHMLQQQLLALTNHVDPAAAAQLAAAAAGDESALTFQPLGPLGPSGCGSLSLSLEACHASLHGACGWHEAWATGSYLQAGSSPGGWQGPSQGASAAGAAAASAAGAAAPAAAAGDQVAGQQQGAVGDPVGSGNGCKSASGSRVAAAGREFGDRMGAVLRHLPVAVRLLRLEGAVRELQGTAVQEVPAGQLQGMQQQLESISERLIAGLTQLEALSSSSMQRLEEQAASLAAAVTALGSSIQERPTHAQVQEAAAAAASRSAAVAVQQQLASLTVELQGVKAGLQGAGQELQQLQEWRGQACRQVDALQAAEQAVKQTGQQLQQQVAADLARQQQEVQQLMVRHSAEVARDTIKQYRADQEATHEGPEAAAARVSSLESKLTVVVAEVDRMQEQAAVAAQLQDKHMEMVAALEAALSAQDSKSATVSQQLRLELQEALAQAQQAHADQAAAVEAAVQEQGKALAGLAATVAELPSKGRLLEYILTSIKATVSELLSQHKKREEGRWEVWLAEFVRVMEQRPTAAQLQKLLQAAQQAAEANAEEAAAQRIQRVSAALESGLRQVQQQVQQLACRTQTLEQGTGIGAGGEGGVCYSDALCGADNQGSHSSSSPSRRPRRDHRTQQDRRSMEAATTKASVAATAAQTATAAGPATVLHGNNGVVCPAGVGSSVAALQQGSSSSSSDASSTGSSQKARQSVALLTSPPRLQAAHSPVPSAAAAVVNPRASSGSNSILRSRRPRAVQSSVGQEQQQQQRAASVTDSITDCTSELQQLLDLQQQVQQCMLESACTQAKPTNEQQQRKKGNRRSVEAQGPEQLQQQVQDPAMQQAAAPQAPGLPQQRSSKSLQVSNLLSLQQQLAQCLKEHSCFLEQQRQQQTVAPSAAAAASSAAARGAGTSSATGTQQQQQQQGQRVGVKEAGLEQLLVLQAQLQQAARRQR